MKNLRKESNQIQSKKNHTVNQAQVREKDQKEILENDQKSEIDNFNQKWGVIGRNNGLFVYNDNNTTTNINANTCASIST